MYLKWKNRSIKTTWMVSHTCTCQTPMLYNRGSCGCRDDFEYFFLRLTRCLWLKGLFHPVMVRKTFTQAHHYRPQLRAALVRACVVCERMESIWIQINENTFDLFLWGGGFSHGCLVMMKKDSDFRVGNAVRWKVSDFYKRLLWCWLFRLEDSSCTGFFFFRLNCPLK